jgi:hypothetical protein
MGKGSGKRKGTSFEREISERISIWLTGRDDCVWHTDGSGGRATNRKRGKKDARDTLHGDLCSTDPKAELFFKYFNVELKSGYPVGKNSAGVVNWSLNDVLDSSQDDPVFFKFWKQALSDALASNREPLLIFRRNRRRPCIAMDEELFNMFIKSEKDKVERSWPPDYFIKIGLDWEGIIIMGLSEFFRWFPKGMNAGILNQTVVKLMLRRNSKNA